MTFGQRPPGTDHRVLNDDAVDALADFVVRATDQARDTVAPYVSHLQLQAITAIDRHDKLNLAGLAELLCTGMSSTCRLCDRLEAAGLIERDTRADNRREIVLRLSPDGRRLLDRIRAQRRVELTETLAAFVRSAAVSTDSPADLRYQLRPA